jgi:hypothetical protein
MGYDPTKRAAEIGYTATANTTSTQTCSEGWSASCSRAMGHGPANPKGHIADAHAGSEGERTISRNTWAMGIIANCSSQSDTDTAKLHRRENRYAPDYRHKSEHYCSAARAVEVFAGGSITANHAGNYFHSRTFPEKYPAAPDRHHLSTAPRRNDRRVQCSHCRV